MNTADLRPATARLFSASVNAISRSKRKTRRGHERARSSSLSRRRLAATRPAGHPGQGFPVFVYYVFGLLRPGILFKPNWHIHAMAHKVSQVASGEVKRLIITVPPRNLKSIIASVALPAWYLGHNPSERVVAVSYSAELAKTHANDFRRVVTDPLYQAVFPKMVLERETDSEIQTTQRGRRHATSIGGTLTGRGGNLFIIDDPPKRSE